jgi:hypothetical protein
MQPLFLPSSTVVASFTTTICHNGNTCTVIPERCFLRKKQFQMEIKHAEAAHALPVKAISRTLHRERDLVSTVSACTPGGETATGCPTGIL